MAIVIGFDIHREQITFDALDDVTGELQRGRIAPADRIGVRGFPRHEEDQGRGGRASAWPRWPVAPLPLALIPLAGLIAAIALGRGHLLWLAFPLFFFVVRPLLWQSAGGRFGYGFRGCGARSSSRIETQL